jgi:hypothetical protein
MTYSTNTIALFHDFEGIVDLSKSLSMGNELVNFECPRQVIFDKLWQFRPSLDSTKGRTFPYTASNKLEWSSLNFLSSSSNTDNDTLTPSFMASFQGSSHHPNIACTVKGVVASAIGHIDEIFLDGFVDFGGIDEIGRAEFLGPFLFAIVGIDCNNF